MTASDDNRGESPARARPRPRYDAYLGQTPGQTLGPFFHQGLLRTRSVFQVPGLCLDERDVFDAELAGPGAFGERIIIEGNVHDGLGLPIADALLEADEAGLQQFAAELDGLRRLVEHVPDIGGLAPTPGQGQGEPRLPHALSLPRYSGSSTRTM